MGDSKTVQIAGRKLTAADIPAGSTVTISDKGVAIVQRPDLFPNREVLGEDGSVRKAHYGNGKQPWDSILAAGWAPEFAAGCIIRYLRRTKDREHSVESARWYYARMHELCRKGHAKYVLGQLRQMLTVAEKELLDG